MAPIQLKQNNSRGLFIESTSLQVRMFVDSNPKEAEKSIGQWLKENDVIIHHIAQSQSEKGGNFLFVLTLFYLQNN